MPIERLYCPGSEVDGRKEFYSEQDPYVKFEQIFGNDGICKGWILTNPDGTKTLYGNLDLGEDRYATRYTFSYGEFAGNVLSDISKLYPYQWDLSETRDVVGNATRFWYQQELKAVHSGTFRSDELTPLFFIQKHLI